MTRHVNMRWLVLALCILNIVALAILLGPRLVNVAYAQSSKGEVGRYNLVPVPNIVDDVYIIDTTTGEFWRVYSSKDKTATGFSQTAYGPYRVSP